ncbi:flagellar M-ring protein FliF [Sphingomonas sp. AP4-R1]|uniref:flagellar basal-body MS-ring/collar protein FliF n=1 Tax=Sphingomonas sp. AP4-R1 TaxID=2735134 RepID=UPI0014932B7F|nr:flagellar basal-body MS-ring/collar protein FliF [Sphingomonas sp. AP4-R1]QJU60488.1 flagellar M-ring protein FliF [Sphingomonas sp. AP4-R1]
MIMGGVVLALLIGIAALAMRGSSSEMGYLYTDLDPSAAQAITEKLKTQGVPFQLSADGTAVMAPVDRMPELRMSLASERLGGKIGYEVLDSEEAFGVSSSRAKINETRAIEGELSKSIESLDRISKARVHIVMPEREIFAAEPRKASAAVTVKTNGRLPKEAVQSIRYLVASSVPELSPAAVSVVDQTGALLARAGEEGSGASGDLDDQQTAIEGRLRSQLESMIEPIVGAGKVRAEIAVSLDRDQTREEADVFDPDTQVIAHQVTVDSNDQNQANNAGSEGVTVGAQLPDANGPITGTGGESQRSARNESSEETSFQNSHKQTVSVRAPGKINRLSVAVMVDGGPQGLPPAQVQRLTRLVENAVGFDAERGDSVVVESMAFSAPPADGFGGNLPFGLTGGQLLDFLKWVVLAGGLIGGAVVLRRRLKPDAAAAPVALTADAEALLALPDGSAPADAAAAQLEDQTDHATTMELLDQEIALAQVDGRIRLSALRRIGDAISKSPAESASVIRQWMNA